MVLLSLKVRLPEVDATKTIQLNSSLLVYDACKVIREKFQESASVLSKGKLPSRSCLLQPIGLPLLQRRIMDYSKTTMILARDAGWIPIASWTFICCATEYVDYTVYLFD